ncbi:MAG: M1 family metallopeptidase [Planctomycetota bacterium]
MPAASRALLLPLLLCACRGILPLTHPRAEDLPVDDHSFSRPNEVRVRHLDLDLTVDFDRRSIEGRATLQLLRRDTRAPLWLDTGTGMSIEDVTGIDGSSRRHVLGEPDPVRGRALRIDLAAGDEAVVVRWTADRNARAVQWLDAEQTASRMGQFLFTQGQAILTRTWIPLQDSPGVRVTWTAKVAVKDHPELVTLMSAQAREVVAPGVTRFSMSHPVPSYLIALAIGRLESRDISSRCAIWAEPSVIEGAARELEDVERMVQAVEALYGPYRFGRYDVLILPPSFPFGGMENPCMTFATPTILTGDKSLVALIAHELAHSWSGNLVTNATWRDFWLNEGFTVYVEQRIVEALFGEERAAAETRNGLSGLDEEMKTLPAADTILHIDLSGRDPDDGMTGIPYDKGAAFLRRIEQVVGRERFDPFLRAWFDEHAFHSLTTADFLAFLHERLLSKVPAAGALDIETWVHGPGLPPDCPRPASTLLDLVDAASAHFLTGAPAGELAARAWTTTQWIHFLTAIDGKVSRAMLDEIDVVYHLTESGNAEILAAWLELNLDAGYAALPPALDSRLAKFLFQVGRRKFVKPLFQALIASDQGRQRARAIYQVVRPRYHAVTRRTIDEMLGWKSDE